MRDRYPSEACPSGLLRIDDTNNRFTQVQRESRAQLLSRICPLPFPSVCPLFLLPAHISLLFVPARIVFPRGLSCPSANRESGYGARPGLAGMVCARRALREWTGTYNRRYVLRHYGYLEVGRDSTVGVQKNHSTPTPSSVFTDLFIHSLSLFSLFPISQPCSSRLERTLAVI